MRLRARRSSSSSSVCLCLCVCVQPASTPGIWDYNIINKRINDNFGGDQDAYTDYLFKQMQGPWAHNVTLWGNCVTPKTEVRARGWWRRRWQGARPHAPPASCSNSRAACSEQQDCPGKWADESAALACNYADKGGDGSVILDGFALADEYYARSLPIVEMQLVKGGVRLAGELNAVW